MRRFVISFGLALVAAATFAAEPKKPWTLDPAALRPFWRSATMEGESVLFMKGSAAATPKASLWFAPTKILSVSSSSGGVVYTEGRDYTWTPGRREITLPAGSRIPFKTPQDLRRPAGSQPYRLTHRDGNGEILFAGGNQYQDMQTLVTYAHRPGAWTGPVPSFAADRLPLTIGKLKAKQPVTIALLGDSISTGCNASGWAGAAPFQPAYQDLLVLNLKATYGAPVSLKNFAVSGTDTGWGLSVIGKVIEARPDLVVLAFGMNDAGGRPAASYQANIQAMIDAVRKARPQCEFILVATMLGNKDWPILHQDLFPQFRDALARLSGPGVALADMTTVWADLLKHKKDWDITGNGVNHPNDFGHRLYAQVLSALLIPDRP
jgi:acyl-CoA thioesterase I